MDYLVLLILFVCARGILVCYCANKANETASALSIAEIDAGRLNDWRRHYKPLDRVFFSFGGFMGAVLDLTRWTPRQVFYDLEWPKP